MGLDMYAWAVPTAIRDGLVNEENYDLDAVDLTEAGVNTTLAYWRKHHHLHGWMQRLYAQKTGIDDAFRFNCVYVELTLEDLDNLEQAIHDRALTPTEGFFFGSHTEYTDADETYDMLFITDARKEITEYRRHVLYHSWW